ncbi:MAG: tocopherol cyclase family protein [Ethanoligenens sp.]
MPFQNCLLSETFQGKYAQAPYFEGWYFRLQNGSHSISLIPGICLNPQPHAYLQILNGEKGASSYQEYPFSAFRFRQDRFAISIGENHFSSTSIHLREPQLHGDISFTNRVPFCAHRLNTGMMGPFAFVPWLQCRHGVVTIRSTLAGALTDDTGTMDFTGGIGYVEKDWGTAFPQPYLWTQAHFGLSTFMLCLARVPLPGGALTGILAFLYTGQKRYLFSTYTGTRLSTICRTEDGAWHLIFRTPFHRLFLRLITHKGLTLRAPGTQGMNREIQEDPHANLSVRLATCGGDTVFQGKSADASAEIVGDLLQLTKQA